MPVGVPSEWHACLWGWGPAEGAGALQLCQWRGACSVALHLTRGSHVAVALPHGLPHSLPHGPAHGLPAASCEYLEYVSP